MKTILIIYMTVLFFSIFTLSSCKEENMEPGCNGEVGLEENCMVFETEGGSHSFKINNDYWWISSLKTIIGNDTLYLGVDSISNPLKRDWYTIEKSTRVLTISVKENTGVLPKLLFVELQAGNCFDGIQITQTGIEDE